MSHLEAKADQAIIPMSSHWKKKEEYMPITTETATRVYVKKENPTGLLQAYTGPHTIVERPGHPTLKVRMGTFKPRVENL